MERKFIKLMFIGFVDSMLLRLFNISQTYVIFKLITEITDWKIKKFPSIINMPSFQHFFRAFHKGLVSIASHTNIVLAVLISLSINILFSVKSQTRDAK